LKASDTSYQEKASKKELSEFLNSKADSEFQEAELRNKIEEGAKFDKKK